MTEKSNETSNIVIKEQAKQIENQSAENESSSFSCDFSANSNIGLKLQIKKQHKNIEELDGNTSLNSSANDDSKPETYETNSEHIFNLKFNGEYWTWPRNRPPPLKVNHP